jgi:hypothetical protein
LIATSVFDCEYEDADDLVALDAAALVDQVDGDLVADAGRLRSAARERPGVVIDGADLDVRGLRGARERKKSDDCRDGTLHSVLP